MKGDGCNEAIKHDVPSRLMTEAAEVVAQKETGVAVLLGDHTPQEKELASFTMPRLSPRPMLV